MQAGANIKKLREILTVYRERQIDEVSFPSDAFSCANVCSLMLIAMYFQKSKYYFGTNAAKPANLPMSIFAKEIALRGRRDHQGFGRPQAGSRIIPMALPSEDAP